MAKHHLDGWLKNLAVITDQFKDWWPDMVWNGRRLVEAVKDRDITRVFHHLHGFVTTTIEKLYRLWGVVFWVYLLTLCIP